MQNGVDGWIEWREGMVGCGWNSLIGCTTRPCTWKTPAGRETLAARHGNNNTPACRRVAEPNLDLVLVQLLPI